MLRETALESSFQCCFNDSSPLSPTSWDVNTALTSGKSFSHNSPQSKTAPLNKLLRPTFRETGSPVPNSCSFNKYAFNIAEEHESFHSFFLKSAVTLNWFPVTVLFIAILNKSVM